MTPDYDTKNNCNKIPNQDIKNQKIAVLLSIFFPGLGQIYNGELKKGLLIEAGAIVGLFIFLIPSIIIGIFSIYDAYITAGKMNEGIVPAKKMRWVYPGLYLLVYILISIGITFIVIEFAFQGKVPDLFLLLSEKR